MFLLDNHKKSGETWVLQQSKNNQMNYTVSVLRNNRIMQAGADAVAL